MSSRAPWERQPGETEAAWQGFVAYRDLGPGRNLQDAARRRYGDERARAPGHFERWSAKGNWVQRARAYDAFVERHARAEQENVWLCRVREQAESTWQLAQRLSERVEEMLAWPLSRTTYSEDGKTVIIEPAKWTMGDLAKMAKLVDDLRRLAIGEPNQRTEVTMKGFEVTRNSIIEALDLSKLSKEQLQTLRELLERARRTPGELEPYRA